MGLSRTTKILYFLLVICAIIFAYEYHRNLWWYEKSPVLCKVVAKDVRQENENRNDSRSTRVVYINHLFVEYQGRIYDKPVGNTSYYNISVGQSVYHSLSPEDIEITRTDGEETLECIVFLIGFVIVIILIVRHIKSDIY